MNAAEGPHPTIDTATGERLADLQIRSARERRRFYARTPKRAADVIAAVIAKRGYAAQKGANALSEAWHAAAASALGGPALAAMTRVAGLSRGVVEVLVANHVVMQEAGFRRAELLAAMQQALPAARLTGVRLRVGRIGD